MQNALEAKTVVLVSTSELEDQLTRIRVALPELRELRLGLAPTDPRREVVTLTITSAERAEEWLTTYIEPWELHRREMETLGDPNA